MNYELLTTENAPVKMWTKGVPVEADARQQLINTAKMPFIFKHIAVMPDVHLGKGSTIGSVIPTKGAIIPAAVGVDIGCGMNALRTALTAEDLPENLAELRQAIEMAVPHGRTTGRCKREWQVLGLIYSGYSNEQIAGELEVAATTIKTHIRNLYQKLGVAHRQAAVQHAQKLLKMMGYGV